ncbi:B3/4 domain-containing protein [Metabacillus iocasae]|uniref:DNA/RNA-binding domain of Phe-tRNA-synthetase-like protein n=1 Tax=Priestia iocasae TaxID=2291674 RepID=A0ABS2QTI3_9BACI|nr:phenylalanine--tRNA ligase beta subunit-related protein [Metabacillus iocasae]MBM7702780.1 DNA/RNA-binding domain of Phe-tRNA-synthetase-like protein [Metabacillus iocasae]
MEIHLSNEIKKLFPTFKIGAIEYKNIQVGVSPQMLQGRLRLFQESIYFDLQSLPIADVEGIKEWRTIFKQLGTDPSKYRPSIEALYRRIQKQTYLPSINSAVDLNNFFSLQYQIPIGIYDLEKLHDSITVSLGKEEESYTGLNNREISLANKLISKDSKGSFGSPYVDSNRAPVTQDTTQAIQLIYLRPSLSDSSALDLTRSLKDMFIQIHGGEASYSIVT